MQGKVMNYSCAHTIIMDDQFAPSFNEGAFYCMIRLRVKSSTLFLHYGGSFLLFIKLYRRLKNAIL